MATTTPTSEFTATQGLPLLDRIEGRVGSESLQIQEHVVRSLGRHPRALVVQLDETGAGERILHDLRAEALEHFHGFSILLLGQRIERKDIVPPSDAEEPEPLTLEGRAIQRGRIPRLGDMPRGGERGKVFGGRPGQDIERDRRVVYGLGDGTDHVDVRSTQGYDAFYRYEAVRDLHSDEALGRGWVLDRAPRLAAESQHREAAVHGGRRPTARSPWHLVHVIGIERLSGDGAVRSGAVARKIGQVGLAEDDRTRGPQPRHYRSIVVRNHVHTAGGTAEALPASRGDEAAVVDIVLDDHGHPVKRAARARTRVLDIQRGRDRKCIGVHRDEGVVVALVARDPRQKRSGELNRREVAGRISR